MSLSQRGDAPATHQVKFPEFQDLETNSNKHNRDKRLQESEETTLWYSLSQRALLRKTHGRRAKSSTHAAKQESIYLLACAHPGEAVIMAPFSRGT